MTTFNGQPFKKSGKGPPALVGVLGAPCDLGATTSGGGQSMAPRGIRLSYLGHPLSRSVVDLGDVQVETRALDDYLDLLKCEVRAALETDVDRLVVLGGDDSVSLGVLRGVHALHGKVHLIHFDAHPDQEDSSLGIDHSSWVDAAIEEGLIREPLVQEDARAGGRIRPEFERVTSSKPARHIGYSEPVVVVVDLDFLDPAFAPGVATPEPGGRSTRDLLELLRYIRRAFFVVALVVTEACPPFDLNYATQRVAARITYDFCRYHS